MWTTTKCTLWTLMATGFFVETTLSYGDGSPSCIPDFAAVGQPHRPDGYEQRVLADEGLTLSIDGQVLTPNLPFAVTIGETVTITVATPTFFKGIMATMRGDIDTSTAFELIPGDEDLKMNEKCDADKTGVTHTNPEDKRSFSWKMTVDEAASNLMLDLTVVEMKQPVSRFYYDQFLITALPPGQTLPPQAAPVTTPKPTSGTREIPLGSPPSAASGLASMVAMVVGVVGSVVMIVW